MNEKERQQRQTILELRHLINKYSLTEREWETCYYDITNPYCIAYYNAEGKVFSHRGYRCRPTLEATLEHINARRTMGFTFSKAVVTYNGSDDIEDWDKPIIIITGDGEIVLGKELCDKAGIENLDVLKIAQKQKV